MAPAAQARSTRMYADEMVLRMRFHSEVNQWQCLHMPEPMLGV